MGEALDSRQPAAIVMYDPRALSGTEAGARLMGRLSGWPDHLYEVSERVLAAASQTETPAGVVAALRLPEVPNMREGLDAPLGLILDGIADPGNVGTILRTADAVGVGSVMLMPGCADPWSPKVVRAGMGAHFRLPVHTGLVWRELPELLTGHAVTGTAADAAETLYDVQWVHGSIVAIGSEAHGLSTEAKAKVTRMVRIPMRPGVESLNASVAAAVIMYHVLGPTLR